MGSTESTLLPMEDDHNSSQATRSRREPDASGGEMSGDDPWWWEIENEDLVLDHEPNVTTESTLGAEGEGGAVALSEDFNTLLKIGQHVSMPVSNNNNNNNNNDNNNSVNDSENITLEEKSVIDLTTEYSNELNDTVNRERHDFDSSSDAVSVSVDAVGDSQSLDEFKEELREKRLARQTALQDLREEIAALRKQLTAEQMLTRRLRQSENAAAETIAGASDLESALENQQHAGNNGINTMTNDMKDITMIDNTDVTDALVVIDAGAQLVDEDDDNACSRSRHANIELANAQLALQLATSENLSLRTELGVTQKQVGTLKEVVVCCKQMIAMKEEQCNQLKTKLSEIEQSFGEREMKIMSDNLRQEYERQLGNIRQLRQLYEERQRIATAEQENLQRLVALKKDELGAEQDRTKNFEERNQALMKEVETVNKELATLREECNEHKFEKKALKEEMETVNTLFSQMVMGFNGKNNLDIDRLATMLEENRTLLNDMATKEASCSDGATLPKLLFELVEQAAVGSRVSSRSVTPESVAGPMAGEEGKENKDEHGDGAVVDAVVEIDAEDAAIKDEESTAANIKVERLKDELQAVQNAEEEQEGEDDDEDADEEDVAVNEADAISSSGNDNNNSSIKSSSQKPHHHHQQHHRKNAANKKKISSPSAASTSTPINSSTILKFHEPNIFGQVASTQEIIGNLPKVWKVLMELLSHHKIEQVQFEENGAGEDCYKSVETPNGPKAELSVSKTYIKLKDLILEKKSLVKETNRLKTLNCHLDYRLNEQEKRLSAVSLELTKTWHLVGKMQRQHRQLHTQEQILRYQLQQKRRLLSELKDELEYCRRKWAAARAKNDESQEQCNDLRREFAKRKLEDANNSAESGYSDSGPASDEEGGRSADPVVEAACSRSELRQMFEHSRKIKRMQSTSPGRAAYDLQMAEVVLRWNSAPPTCGWRADTEENEDGSNNDSDDDEMGDIAADGGGGSHGAIPKQGIRSSRSKQRVRMEVDGETSAAVQEAAGTSAGSSVSAASRGDHVVRIQRLEEQCKSLIQQVLETSDSRERLEVQLCRFQDAIAPVQYAMPLDDLVSKKRLERMTRASSAPASPAGTLTPREEEYTRKRSERLGRLEEESRQLISRIKRTSDRGQYLRCSLERLHRTCNRGGDSSSAAISRESSFDSNTEEEAAPPHQAEGPNVQKKISSTESPLTEAEEAYTTRRADRLKRLEAESKQLLTQLGQNKQRGTMLSSQLDVLHQQHGDEGAEDFASTHATASATSPTVEKRIENIERMSSNRAERLRILEEEGKLLISRLSSTSERGTLMINRIAEREQNRAARQHETAAKEAAASREGEKPFTNNGSTSADEEDDEEEASSVAVAVVAVVAADPLLPTLKNVACSSIVSEELAECVTVTTTTSQIAHNIEIQGAVPKSKPLAQLSVANVTKSKSRPATSSPSSGDTESLEEMVKRLQSMPFPGAESEQTPIEQLEEQQEEQPEERIEEQPEEQPEEHIEEQIEEQTEHQTEEQSRDQLAEVGELPDEELKESHET